MPQKNDAAQAHPVTVLVRDRQNRLTAAVERMAADYVFRQLTPHEAWDELIRDRGLRPDVDFKTLRRLMEDATPEPLEQYRNVNFTATHWDVILDIPCQITQAADKVYHIIWANGATGSNPPFMPPDKPRFITIQEASMQHDPRSTGG